MESPEQCITSILNNNQVPAVGLEDDNTVDKVFNVDTIVWAVNNFSPYNLPDPEEILRLVSP